MHTNITTSIRFLTTVASSVHHSHLAQVPSLVYMYIYIYIHIYISLPPSGSSPPSPVPSTTRTSHRCRVSYL